MKQKILAACAVSGIALFSVGCAHHGDTQPDQPAPSNQPSTASSNSSDASKDVKKDDDPGGIIGKIPPRSPFAKLTVGMSQDDVDAKLGPPTYRRIYPTGRGFIPFYYGVDRFRYEYRYKGQGVIVFSGGAGFAGAAKNFTIFRVTYDPSETGDSK